MGPFAAVTLEVAGCIFFSYGEELEPSRQGREWLISIGAFN